MMLAVPLPARSLPVTVTLFVAMISTPVPVGTVATILPLGAKLGVSLSITLLPLTVTHPAPRRGSAGKSNTRMPPVLCVTMLPVTSAWPLFSISIPATL